MGAKLTEAQEAALRALAGEGETIIGGINLGAVVDLEKMRLIENYHDPFWPASFATYRITEAGRRALTEERR